MIQLRTGLYNSSNFKFCSKQKVKIFLIAVREYLREVTSGGKDLVCLLASGDISPSQQEDVEAGDPLSWQQELVYILASQEEERNSEAGPGSKVAHNDLQSLRKAL